MPSIDFDTRGAEKISAAHDKIDKAAKKTQHNYRLTAREAKNLERVEQQIVRSTETAWERRTRKLNEAKRALAGNARETELLQRQVARLNLEYLKAGGSADKLSKSELAAAKKLDAAQKQALARRQQMDTVGKSAFSVARLTAWGGGLLSVHKILATITEELRLQQELVDKKNATQLSVSASRNVLLRNLVGQTPETIAGVQDAVSKISDKSGVSEVAINQAMAETLSATNVNVELSQALVGYAAQFLADRPSQIGEFAGSLGDITRVTGSNDPTVALGLLAQVGQASRVVNPKSQAENIAPALIGTLPYGGDASTSGALFAALSTGAADVTGQKTRTATINFVESLDEQVKKAAAGEDAPEWATKMSGMGLRGRIAYLQSHRDVAELLLPDLNFGRATHKGPGRQLLLDPESAVARDYAANLERFGTDNDALRRKGSEAMGVFQHNTLEPVAAADRAIKQAREAVQVRNASKYVSSEQLDSIADIFREAGELGFERKFREFADRLDDGKVSLDEVTDELRSAGEYYGRKPGTRYEYTGGYAPIEVYDAPTEDQKSLAPILLELANKLDAQLKIMEEQKEAQQASVGEQQVTNDKLDDLDGGMVGGTD